MVINMSMRIREMFCIISYKTLLLTVLKMCDSEEYLCMCFQVTIECIFFSFWWEQNPKLWGPSHSLSVFSVILKVTVANQVLGMRIANLNSTIWIGEIKGSTLPRAIFIHSFLWIKSLSQKGDDGMVGKFCSMSTSSRENSYLKLQKSLGLLLHSCK